MGLTEQLNLFGDPLAAERQRVYREAGIGSGVDASEPTSGAVISECGRYRYELWRRWSDAPPVLFVMLNPSTADHRVNDPTIRKCIGYARTWGYGGLLVGNLFAYRATDPDECARATDPVGPENDTHLARLANLAPLIVCAWGRKAGKVQHGRDKTVVRLLTDSGVDLHALKVLGGNTPGHPLFLRGDLQPQKWEVGG